MTLRSSSDPKSTNRFTVDFLVWIKMKLRRLQLWLLHHLLKSRKHPRKKDVNRIFYMARSRKPRSRKTQIIKKQGRRDLNSSEFLCERNNCRLREEEKTQENVSGADDCDAKLQAETSFRSAYALYERLLVFQRYFLVIADSMIVFHLEQWARTRLSTFSISSLSSVSSSISSWTSLYPTQIQTPSSQSRI